MYATNQSAVGIVSGNAWTRVASVVAGGVVIGAACFLRLSLLNILLTALLASSCYADLLSFRIPNWLTYPTIVIAIVLNVLATLIAAWTDTSVPDWLGAIGGVPSVLGGCVGGGVMLLALGLNGGGAGDVKLALAIGTIVGPRAALVIIVYTQLLAAIFALVWISWLMGPRRVFARVGHHAHSATRSVAAAPVRPTLRELLGRPLPIAGFFAGASILVLGGPLG